MSRRRNVLRAFVLIFLAFAFGIWNCHGQWTTQTITLNPGWNAVFLEVQPANDDCDAVFAGIPVESVWAWNRHYSSVQFIQDPTTLVPGHPDWLTYLPGDHPARNTRNLFAIQGARPYLIKLKSGATTTTWTVIGQPIFRVPDWLSDSLNFVGFPLGSGSTPTFQDFFSGSTAHTNQPIYRLNSVGQWVASAPSSTMRAGESFWIYCAGASTFSGPLQLTLEQRDGLLYGRFVTEQTLRIQNNSASVRAFAIQVLASQTPPGTNFPVLAGAVPLSYYVVNITNSQFGWFALPSALQNLNVPPGQEWVVRLEVNRTNMAAFTPPPGNNGVLYQSILQVSDSTGVRVLLPVSSEGLTSYNSTSAKFGRKTPGTATNAFAGLWVGSATINKVSQPANITSPTTPLATGSPLDFRLLIHLDNSGNARLLQKVLEMFKDGVVQPDPNNPSNNIVVQPGHYVLVTDDSLIPQFKGVALTDSQLIGRRLSTAVFSFPQPILLSPISGSFGSGSFACQINLDYDDRLNPFKHLYHPDHDNLDNGDFQTKLGEGAESFKVIRQIELDFTATDPDNLTVPGWGDDQLGGIYKETISGLHSQSIYISGTFRLARASSIAVLNDGL